MDNLKRVIAEVDALTNRYKIAQQPVDQRAWAAYGAMLRKVFDSTSKTLINTQTFLDMVIEAAENGTPIDVEGVKAQKTLIQNALKEL